MRYALFILLAAMGLPFSPLSAQSEQSPETPDSIRWQEENQTEKQDVDQDPRFSPFLQEDLAAPEEPGTNRFLVEFLNMLLTLGFVIALILVVAWFFRRMLNTRMQQLNVTSTIKILERRTLTPKSAIYLLEVLEKQIVIAESPSGIQKLTEAPVKEENETPKTTAFREILEEKRE